jgi:hypothetical protein
MKPNWENAPKWANYLAMDEIGEWWWYECKPLKNEKDEFGVWETLHRAAQAYKSDQDWAETLESRPE